MPVDVAVEEPGAGVVRLPGRGRSARVRNPPEPLAEASNRGSAHREADRDVVARDPDAHDVALDGVDVVRHCLARAPDDREGVLREARAPIR